MDGSRPRRTTHRPKQRDGPRRLVEPPINGELLRCSGSPPRPGAPSEMDKSADAFRTISEVAEELDLPQHVLRFWETRFPQIKPMKRAGGRRFYRPTDIEILRAVRRLLYSEGYTIKGVQRILKEQGPRAAIAPNLREAARFQPGSETSAQSMQQTDPRWNEDFRQSRPPSNDAVGLDREEQRAEGSPLARKAFALSNQSRTEAVERLKSILRDLEECERMLDAARRH
jgi:DNA-binding transcriptional MerR regulator